MRRKALGLLLVGALLFTAGCAIDATVDSSVSADGTVETYEVELNMSSSVHSQMESRAQQQGYDSVGGYFLGENVSADRSNAENVDISEQTTNDNTTVTIRMEGYDPGPDSNISVRQEDGRMIYEDVTFGTEGSGGPTPTDSAMSMEQSSSIEYTLEMPGTVQSASEGGIVSGNTVTWEAEGEDPSVYVYAESEVPQNTDGGGGGGGDGGGSSGFGPGFGVIGAVVALLAAALVAARRRRAD